MSAANQPENPRAEPDHKERQILWTGGWDSTFAVLDALWNGDTVQPLYVRDPARQSTSHELAAIDAISRDLDKVFRAPARERLMDLKVIDQTAIPPDPDIARDLAEIRQIMDVGSQYDWLLPLARQLSGDMLELSVQKRPGAKNSFSYLLRNDLTQDGHGGRLMSQLSRPELRVYLPFYFPVIHLTKRDMYEIARDRGWLGLMRRTHFCHRPRKSSKPCGKCNPCRIAWQQGMRFRFPLKTRLKLAMQGYLRPDTD